MNKITLKKTFTTLSVLSVIAVLVYFSVNAFTIKEENTSTSRIQPKYSNVRIFATQDQDFRTMEKAGLIIDHANRKPGLYLDAWLSEYEMGLLNKSGVAYQVLVDDWDAYYRFQSNLPPQQQDGYISPGILPDITVNHSIYGSMGGYCTFAEVTAKLDSMRLQYPQFISTKFSIGTTTEGRTMWAVRITHNPDAPTGRPEVLYHSLIHAREPESMETEMYYFYWLFENYPTNPDARYILNNREIYWVPVFNADGYEYNHSQMPNGGGMWRENRRNNGSNCFGVDLNRNYGIYQFWNSSNNGSSTTPTCGQGTYRGPNPFSEPETQNMMAFVNSRNFNDIFGAHTYGNYLIKPWAWSDPNPTPDDNKFSQFLADMKASNPTYTTGTPSGTVGYFVRGDADDWYYNDSANTSHHIFGITPETGTMFWPPQSQIIPLAQGMFFNNKYMSLIAGPYVNPLSKAFNQPTYTPGQSGNYKVVLRNKGLVTATNVHVLLTSASSNITIPVTQYNYASLASFATDSSTFNFTISASAPNNCAITTNLTIKLDTTTIYTAPAYVLVGTGTVVLNDNAENGITNWTTSGGWAVNTSSYHSPTHSFAYAPYPNNADGSLTEAVPVNLSSSPVCILSFWQRYDVENGYDFVNVEVSSDNGTTWQPVASFTGTNLTWTQQTYDISSFANGSSQTKIRFHLTSDQSLTGQGWWVDDVTLNNYCGTLTGISHNNGEIPKVFALEQNYPNPFNPSTTIKYQLPGKSFVSIKIYDILGREVTELVNSQKGAGYYEVSFDASNYASGMYFYKIDAHDITTGASFVVTKKMALIK